MDKKPNWKEVFESYQLMNELFSDGGFVARASDVIQMMCSATGANDGVLMRNTGKLQLFGDFPERECSPEDVLSALPILYGNFPCTKFKDNELRDILALLDLPQSDNFCEGFFFSFELDEDDSLWFLMFRDQKTGPMSEEEFQSAAEASELIEQLLPLVSASKSGDTLARKLEEQKQRENVWLESLDWLNDVGKKELSSAGIKSFYKTSIYQLKLLARAKFSQAFRANTEERTLKCLSDLSEGECLTEVSLALENLLDWQNMSSSLKSLDFELQPEQAEQIGAGHLIVFPIYIQKKLSMLLCLGRDEAFRESERKIARLFAEGVNHFVERSYFLGALKHNNRLLREEKQEQEKLIEQLEQAKNQLLQQEKLASIGQLAAGVAHEINNPVGYVSSNISMLDRYFEGLYQVLALYENAESSLPDDIKQQLKAKKDELYFEDFKSDIKDIIAESKEGVERVKQIVGDMKDFSHVSEAEWQKADLAVGIDSTLNIVHNELKFKAEVIKEYQAVPEVECMPSRINQVVMNLLVNAAHAIEEKGKITVRLFPLDASWVCIEVEDTGHGIEEKNLCKLFDPFFTTKPVGKGTGLGLSLSYSIVESHGGELTVKSKVGEGTTFRLTLPVQRGGQVQSEV